MGSAMRSCDCTESDTGCKTRCKTRCKTATENSLYKNSLRADNDDNSDLHVMENILFTMFILYSSVSGDLWRVLVQLGSAGLRRVNTGKVIKPKTSVGQCWSFSAHQGLKPPQNFNQVIPTPFQDDGLWRCQKICCGYFCPISLCWRNILVAFHRTRRDIVSREICKCLDYDQRCIRYGHLTPRRS